VRDEELPGQGQVVHRADPGQDDRAIARDPVTPEGRLAPTIGGDLGGAGPLFGAGEDDVRGQALELVGVLGRPAAVPVLELAVGPGQLEGPGRRARLVELVGQGEGLLARRGDRGREGDDGGPRRLQPTRRRRLRIGSRTGPVVPESVAPGSRAAGSAGVRPRPRKRTRSVSCSSLALERGAGRRAVHGRDVDGPDRLLVGRSGPAPAEQRVEAGDPFGLQEELLEGGVGQVGRRGPRTTST
jgi:hypothetical protein